MVGVLENLQPHEDVEELNISSFRGSRFPSWISMLANLLRLELSNCDYITKLPALWNLASLEKLALKRMKSVNNIGREFYGFDDTSNPDAMDVAFPQLKVLDIEEMDELVEWELPVARDNKKIMPCLSVLKLSDCPMLRALPIIEIDCKDIRTGEHGMQPKYQAGELYWMAHPIHSITKKLIEIGLLFCPMLRALPGLGTLESLEDLRIINIGIKEVGYEFLGISAAGDEFGGGEGEGEGEKGIVPNNLRNISSAERKGSDKPGEGGSSSSSSYVLFPKLTRLKFCAMKEWEVWILPPFQEDIQIMPRLTELSFSNCEKLRALPDLTRFKSLEILKLDELRGLVELEREEEGISFPGSLRELALLGCTSLRVIPGYLFPHTLRKLVIFNCPQLRGVQPCLPPLLESLRLIGDVGVFSESLPIAEDEENNNNYPNLKTLEIWYSNHPSLPKGFNHLTAIQYLQFWGCKSLDFDLNELKHLTMLQKLVIDKCPILAKRFQSSGDDWMTILSHVPKITIDGKYIKGSFYSY